MQKDFVCLSNFVVSFSPMFFRLHNALNKNKNRSSIRIRPAGLGQVVVRNWLVVIGVVTDGSSQLAKKSLHQKLKVG